MVYRTELFELASTQSPKLNLRTNRVDFYGRKLDKVNFHENLNVRTFNRTLEADFETNRPT